MKIGVLKYPGGHGDSELMQVFIRHFDKDVREVWYKESDYSDIGTLFIGGGFPCFRGVNGRTCFDDSPALRYLPEFASGGNHVVGFGNGFQVLCEAGLLPGMLERNISGKFMNKQVYIKPENHSNSMTSGLKSSIILRIPLATEYGRYSANEVELLEMRLKQQILFRYCDQEGRISEAINYTGSTDNIAGVCNSGKNVFGMIPQPERALTEFLHESDGKSILSSFLKNS